MKRKTILALLLALLLLAAGCGQVSAPADDTTNGEAADGTAVLDTAALSALLESLAPSEATVLDLRGGRHEGYPAAGAIRAEDHLTALRSFTWKDYHCPSDWEDTSEVCYALKTNDAVLTLYLRSAAVLRAETADGEGWFTVPYLEDETTGEVRQTSDQLYDAVRSWYLEAQAAARYAYGGTPLTSDELTFFEAYTASTRTEDGVTYATPISCFFTSAYSNVRDLDAKEFITYCPGEGYVTNADGEEAQLIAEKLDLRGSNGQRFSVDDLPVPCHRLSRAYLDGILTEYADVTTAEMSSDWTAELFYLPETDCFYTFTSDFGPGTFRPVYGERSGDTVRLWTSGEGSSSLTLEQDGGLWLIRSYEPSGEPLYSVAYLGYGEASDLSYYADALGLGEDVPTYYVSGGDYYLIIPRHENMQLSLYRNDMETGEQTLMHEEDACRPFILACNVSDIFPDAAIVLTWQGETVEFSPFLSLRDGSLDIGTRGANITRAE